MADSTFLARTILNKCNTLLAGRTRYSNKVNFFWMFFGLTLCILQLQQMQEEYARDVLYSLLADPTLDLLLLKPHFDTLHADALNRLNALIGFESSVFMVWNKQRHTQGGNSFPRPLSNCPKDKKTAWLPYGSFFIVSERKELWYPIGFNSSSFFLRMPLSKYVKFGDLIF